MTTKRNVTDADRAAARELKRLWEEYKEKPENAKTSQAKVAKLLGFTQSMFSQLMGENLPWAPSHVKVIGDFFKVPYSSLKVFNDLPNYEQMPSASSTQKTKKEFDANEILDPNKDRYWEGILYCYPKLSDKSKDILATLANKLLEADQPGKGIHSPYEGPDRRKEKQEQ